MRREYYRWLQEAKWDLDTARILHREKRYNAAAFYAQQAAEKAMKALLYKINEAAWGHSVRELLIRFSSISNINLNEELLTCARELDRHYIPARYPNAHPSGTPHEAYDEETSNRALQCAEKLINFAEGIINDD